MKLIHLSDLHIGKRVNEFSMLEDQAYILEQILEVIDEEGPDGVMIAGDVYDKAVPSAEAVQLFDHFLVSLSGRQRKVFIISGNHDSPERLAFGSRIMSAGGIYLSPVYQGRLEPISLADDHGLVHIYLLPFVKPAHVQRYFPEESCDSYTAALQLALGQAPLNPKERNVLITHQFVTGATICDSEERAVGGSDQVDGSIFAAFDYVALGHLHGPQRVGRDTMRYCGTPLKYSLSELTHEKSITVVELGPKGAVTLRTVPLRPKRDLIALRGSFKELTAQALSQQHTREDYVHVTLTDEEDVFDAVGKLRGIYPNLMSLGYDNQRSRASAQLSDLMEIEAKSPLALFREFYEKQNNAQLSEEQEAYLLGLMEEIWEGCL